MQEQDVAGLCRSFPAPDFYLSPQAAMEAVRLHRPFNVIHPATANKIDFMVLASEPWALAQFNRRLQIEFRPDCLGFVAAPEDVILGKLVYYQEGGSDKHLRDVAGILKISGQAVDRDYVSRFAQTLGVSEIWMNVQAIAD